MKKSVLSIVAFLILSITSSFAGDGNITLLNDTGNKLSVHTGTGTTSLNANGGKTSFSCKVGKSIKVDGKEIFKVTEKMCGETVKLSAYLGK
jgi:RNase P/RNase MRP subunit p29